MSYRQMSKLLFIVLSIVFFATILTGSASAHGPITTDGSAGEWMTGFGSGGCPALPASNASAVYTTASGCTTSNGAGAEYIWTDEVGDRRLDHWGGTGNMDMTQFRVTVDTQNLYILMRFSDITDCNAQYIQIAVGSSVNPTAQVTLPDNMETTISHDWFRVIEANTTSTGVWQNAATFLSMGSSFCSPTNDVWEISIPRFVLSMTDMIESATTFAFSIVVACNNSGTPCEATGSDVMDAITTIGPNTFNEVSDGVLNYSINPVPQTLTCASYSFPYTMTSTAQSELVDAIQCANTNGAGADTINLNGQTVSLIAATPFANYSGMTGLPQITSNITIRNGTIFHDMSGGGFLFRTFSIASGGTLNIQNVVLDGASAPTPGGAFHNSGTLNVTNSTMFGYDTGNRGGVLYNGSGATANFANSLFYNNHAVYAHVMDNAGSVNIVNSTFDKHTSAGQFGFILEGAGYVVRNSIFWNPSSTQVQIQTGNTVSDSIVKGGYSGGTNILNTNPLFVNEGTNDFRIQLTSPAVNTGVNAYVPLDTTDVDGDLNTGENRPDLDLNPRIVATIVDMGAYERQDATPPDPCLAITFPYTLTGNTPAELRQAIECANANGTADVIDLNAQTVTLTDSFADYSGATGLPQITTNITLRNGTITRSGSNLFRIVSVNASGTLSLRGITISNGGGSGYGSLGAGVHNLGTTAVINSNIVNNTGNQAVALYSTNTLNIVNSTIAGNFASTYTAILEMSGTATIANSVISGNRSTTSDNIAINSGTLTVTNSTVAYNYAAVSANNASGAFYKFAGATLIVQNSIIWGNRNSSNTADQIEVSSGTPTVSNSIIEGGIFGGINADPLFVTPIGVLSTPTTAGDFRLNNSSPAIDAGANANVPLDTYDVDGDSNTTEEARDLALATRRYNDAGVTDTGTGTAPIVDMGAYERQTNSDVCAAYVFPYTMTGNTPAELIAAIECANANANGAGADTINLNGQTVTLTDSFGDFSGATGLPQITTNITVRNGTITRTGSNEFRFFAVSNTGNLTVRDMTMTNGGGTTYASNGGSINTSGTTSMLNVINTTISGSRNDNLNNGSAIFSNATFTIVNSSVLGGGFGRGAIASNNGPALIQNTLIAGNSGPTTVNGAGGVYFGNMASATIENSTIVGNYTNSSLATQPGGVYASGGTVNLTIRNSIIWGNRNIGNTSPQVVNATAGTNTVTNSIIEGGIFGALNSDPLFVTPITASSTPTTAGDFRLGNFSPAIDAGANANVPLDTYDVDGDSNTTEEARDRALAVRRYNDINVTDTGTGTAPIVDMGAYERQANSNICALYVFPYTMTGNTPAELRQAILCANSNGLGADTIDLNGQTVTLTDSFANYLGNTGLPQITTNMTLQNGTITRSGSNQFRILNVASSINVNLNSITISNGSVNGLNSGGGIYNNGGTLTITNSTISGNSTDIMNGNGGGIINDGGSLTITNSTISGNSASPANGRGGGIYNISGTLTITSSTLSGNTASTLGGGIFNSGTLIIINSDVSGNTVTAVGGVSGGIYNNSIATITNSTVSSNSSIAFGGGITNDGTLTMTNSIVSGNSSGTNGGGIYNGSGTLTITNTTVSGNNATTSGGGIYRNGGTVNIRNSILWGNNGNVLTGSTVTYSLVEGGFTGTGNLDADPLFVTPIAFTSAPTSTGNFQLSNLSPAIDAGANANVPLDTYDVDGDSNTAEEARDRALAVRRVNDAGVTDTGTGTAPIVDLGAYERQTNSDPCVAYVFPYTLVGADNTARVANLRQAISCANANGAGADTINLNGQTVTLSDSFDDFSGATGLPQITSNMTLQNGTITRDTSGPAFRILYVSPTGFLTLSAVNLSNGDAGSNDGGAIESFLGTVTVTGGTISNNTADSGGAISNYGTFSATNTIITDNTSSGGGGGIFNWRMLNLTGVTVSSNSAATNGGGIANYNPGTAVIVSSIISGNQANSSGGGIVSSNSLILTNSVVSGNLSPNFTAGGIYSSGTTTLNNSTVAGNFSGATTGGLYISSGSVTLNNSLIYGNEGSTNNNISPSGYTSNNSLIGIDPSFVNLLDASDNAPTTGGDYRLGNLSAAIDAGDNSLIPGGITTDLDNNPRRYNDTGVTDTGSGTAPIVDIGAYEKQTNSVAPTVTVTQSGGTTNITEAGVTDTYTVVLDAVPSSDVTISVTGDADASVSPTSLTFTTANWNIAQTVTVTAVNDQTVEGSPHTGTITHSASGGGYIGVSVASVTANITDNDSAVYQFNVASSGTFESVGNANILVETIFTTSGTGVQELEQAITVPFTISGSSTATGGGVDYTLAVSSITIPVTGTYSTITATLINDVIDEPDETIILTLGVETTAPTLARQDAVVTLGSTATHTHTILDNDTAALVITETGGTTDVTESGVTDTYTVALATQPITDVVVELSYGAQVLVSTNGVNFFASPITLTFTSANWNTPQTITVQAVDDAVAEGAHNTDIDHEVVSGDTAYTNLSIVSVNVAITDNDTAGVVISSYNTYVAESLVITSYTVRLSSEPTADVIVVASPDAQVTLNILGNLTFNASDWNVPVTVEVIAIDDPTPEASPHTGVITHSVTSSDAMYNAISVQNVTVSIADNDSPLSITKSIVATNQAHTSDATLDTILDPRPVTIGEIITYRLVAEIPEGTSQDVQITDILAPNIELISGTAQISYSAGNAMSIPDVSGILNEISPSTDIPAGKISFGVTGPRELNFSLGQVVNTDEDYQASIETIIIEFEVFVVNTSDNFSGTTWFNSFGIDLTNDGTVDGTSNSVFAIVHEPLLTITKSITNGSTGFVAGGIVEYTISINNPGGVNLTDAFDVVISDTFDNTRFDWNSFNPTNISAGLSSIYDSSTGVLQLTQSQLSVGESANIVFEITVLDPMAVDQLISNTATVTWTSLPGVDVFERTGDMTGENDYSASSTVDFYTGGQLLVELSSAAITQPEATANLSTPTLIVSGGITLSDYTVDLVITDIDTNSGDYAQSTQTITLPAGDYTSPTAVSIPSTVFSVINDAVVEGNERLMLTLGSPNGLISVGDANGNSITVNAVEVTITDNDSASVSFVAPTSNANEGTTPHTVAAQLVITANGSGVASIQKDYTTTVTATNGTATDVLDFSAPTSITFIAGSGNSATQNVNVTIADDAIDEIDEDFTLTVEGTNHVVTILDDDTAGVTITGAPVSVTEGGTTDTYTVVLNTQPSADVTVTVTGDAQASVSPTSLTFTTGNWNLAQTVTVTAVDDLISEGAHTGTITHSAAGGGYDAVSIADVTANIIDNDTAGVTLNKSNVSVTEGGATDTYTVVLNTQPSADVTVTVTGDTQASVSPTTLTFTTVNWNIAQTVTVTAVNDVIAEGAHTGTITHSAAGGGYDAVSIADVTANIVDNDTAGVTLNKSNVSVTEGGTTDTYTVVLNTQPSADVTVTVTGDAQASVSPTSLTFTTGNWNLAQTVTVTAVDDLISEGAHTGTITHSAAGGGYDAVSIADVTANIIDNDTAGVTLNKSNVSVTEGGATDTYTVVLNTQPSADVTVTVTGDTQASVSPTTLTFTTVNWNIAQTVTVTAVNDVIAEGAHTGTITHSAAGGGYDAVSIADVTANIVDNDTAGVTLNKSNVSVTEGGTTDTYTVVLNTQPSADVTVTVTGDAQASVSPLTLTFTTGNWNIAQTVTVTAVNDVIAEGAHTGTITHSAAGGGYGAVVIANVTANIVDNDTAGVTLNKSNVSVTEGGATDTYTVVLNTQPSADVTVTVTGDAQASVSPLTLTFTTGNWNIAQTVTVTAVNDVIAEGAHTGTITHSAAGGGYDAVSIADVTANIVDNDTAGVTVTPTTVSVTEGGTTDTYTVVLNTQPSADVTVTVTGDAQASVSPLTLTFTTGNWNIAQTVTVTAVNDVIAEGAHTGTITHSASGGGYDAVVIGSVTANIIDNDTAGVTVTPTTVNVTEGGTTDTYTVVLNTQPSADVTVTVTGDAQASVSPLTLTFTTVNWNIAQTVTVTAVNDVIAEGAHSGIITHSAAGGGYDAVSIADVTANIVDNDTAGVTVTPTTVNVTEGGTTDTYTVVLNTQPSADVTITVTGDAQASVSPLTLTFTTGNWNIAQTVTVTAVNDVIAEGAHTGTITHSASGGGYDAVVIGSVTANIIDNDTAGVTVTPTTVNVTEGGTTDTYTVVLNTQPSADVTVTVTGDTQASVSPLTLTFTTVNWNIAQTVTVTAVNDVIAEGAHSGIITHSAAGGGYDAVSIADVTANITDNDVAAPVNLLLNPSFEDAGTSLRLAASWTGKKLTSKDRRACDTVAKPVTTVDGTCAFQFDFTGPSNVSRSVRQIFIAPAWGDNGDTLTLSAQVSGNKFKTGAKMVLQVIYTDGTRAKVVAPIPTKTYAYTELTRTLNLTKRVKKVLVVFNIGKSGGRVWIDDTLLLLNAPVIRTAQVSSSDALIPLPRNPESFRGEN